MKLIKVCDTRPGGSNRQERAHRAGAPFTRGTHSRRSEMIQRHRCVSLWCDQCGECPGRVSFISHFPDEAVLGAVSAAGWWRSDERLLWLCAATGHEFTVWYQTRRCGCSRGRGGHPGGAGGCGLEFRYCTGCGRDEFRYTKPVAGLDTTVVE